MSEPKLTQQDVQEILNLVESAAHVTDFSLKYGDVEVRLSKHAHAEAPSAHTSAPRPQAVQQPAAGATPPPVTNSAAKAMGAQSLPLAAGMTAIKAPMVGTFYRASAPGAKPFVEVGQKVGPDSVVCIIEVMKLMSSISAGVSGTVKEIRVADSEPVQFGQVLVVIEPDA